MSGDELVDIACHLQAAGVDKQQVITHAFQISNYMRRQQNRQSIYGYRRHELLKELMASKRIKAGKRLIKEQKFRPFGKCHCEGYLRSLTT